jgi:hypothetical protein
LGDGRVSVAVDLRGEGRVWHVSAVGRRLRFQEAKLLIRLSDVGHLTCPDTWACMWKESTSMRISHLVSTSDYWRLYQCEVATCRSYNVTW